MKDWQLDAMWEEESDRIWEEQNKDPDLTEAINRMDWAMDHAADVATHLGEAIKEAEGTVYEARIMSIFEDLKTLQSDMTGLKARMEEEKRKSA